MQTTTSVHWNKGELAREHNERDEALCNNENKKRGNKIDLYNEHGDSFHEVLVRTDLRTAYQEIFGDALNDYNAKQKRADRRMTIDDYIQSIENDTRGKRQTKIVNKKRVVDTEARRGKQLSYEITVKVGNVTERALDDNGCIAYDDNNHHIHTQELPRDLQNEILREYARTFQQNNPNLRLINMDLHADEGFYNPKGVWEYSTNHLHCEIIPVASGFKQGMSVQNSMNKALSQMGFSSNDKYHEWATKEQKRLEEITHRKYREYCQTHSDFYKDKGDLEIIHPVRDKKKDGDKSKETIAMEQETKENNLESKVLRESSMDAFFEQLRINDELQEEKKAYQEKIETLEQEYQEKLKVRQEALEKEFQKKEDALESQKRAMTDEMNEEKKELNMKMKKVKNIIKTLTDAQKEIPVVKQAISSFDKMKAERDKADEEERRKAYKEFEDLIK